MLFTFRSLLVLDVKVVMALSEFQPVGRSQYHRFIGLHEHGDTVSRPSNGPLPGKDTSDVSGYASPLHQSWTTDDFGVSGRRWIAPAVWPRRCKRLPSSRFVSPSSGALSAGFFSLVPIFFYSLVMCIFIISLLAPNTHSTYASISDYPFCDLDISEISSKSHRVNLEGATQMESHLIILACIISFCFALLFSVTIYAVHRNYLDNRARRRIEAERLNPRSRHVHWDPRLELD